ncbi:MAG: zinc dependent phospholipase C family protein, partial [Anaerolineales bacterium]|nr:zinc dependent phospholipase C family protein [Anaerolineales bacterium]
MATWIAHLRLAENLLEKIEGLDAAWFAIGSIAPDSGIPDENWENFTPPKEVSHFIVPSDDDPWRIVDLEFYRRYLLPMHWPSADAARFSFFLGYFLHLVTDNLWNQQIGRPTVTRFKAEFEADPKFIWQVKRDWYGLDFIYLRDHPESLFWRVFLDCEYTWDYQLAFMPAEGLRRQVDY